MELPPEQYADLIRDYCREFFVSKGMIADFAIHDKGKGKETPGRYSLSFDRPNIRTRCFNYYIGGGLMEYDPTLATLLAQPWSNNVCRGYTIYAMETLTRHELEKSVYDEMVKKMREFQTLTGNKAEGYNPKLTAARAKLAKIEATSTELVIHWKI